MICPGCGVAVSLASFEQKSHRDGTSANGFEIITGDCPECKQFIIGFRKGTFKWMEDEGELVDGEQTEILFPKITNHLRNTHIPESFRSVFNESRSVLPISPKASATLSRRLLQTVLREHFKIKKKDLAEEIREFITNQSIPEEIRNYVDAVRNVGNFAAHPIKYQNTAEIAEVEPGEAEWLLEVLETLFEYTFVQPGARDAKKDQLNEKLKKLGKPPLIQ